MVEIIEETKGKDGRRVLKVAKENLVDLIKELKGKGERQQYDMLGIVFEGHPNMKRLFLPDTWVGHPLRKNYDLSKVQYVNMDEDGNDYATFDPGDGW